LRTERPVPSWRRPFRDEEDNVKIFSSTRPPSRMLGSAPILLSALLVAAGCVPDEPEPREAVEAAARSPESERRAPSYVDSIFPIEESLRRFREAIGPETEGLSGGATSRDALVESFVAALAASDTAAFADMSMTREEFGWLYYPHTRFTSSPYAQAPALLWFQIESGTSRGLGRLLQRHGGTELVVVGYRCAPEPLIEERNNIWEECVLRIDPPEGEPVETRLFGSILERNGVFKFVSYTNDF
jgi:hypothetical protein